MGKIKILDEQLANQIAAGEVVERPAAVIKELVENAIDAGSTTIDITIEEGGLTLMRVVDNGYGIEASDILTAFQRHATSKISTSSDLFKIASLGFRGEALPSIAAVSRLSCTSADTDTGLARQIVIEGGNITVNEPANAPQGTDMIVRDLFYNTPARLKYMKAIQTELGHISDYVNRIALAHPGIAFTFKHNGSTLLQTVGTGDRLQVIAAIYGTNTAKAMLPINRYPLAVIELGMHPSLLDVNVHPSKMEVRFSKEAELRTLLEEAVRKVLGKQRYIPGPDAGKQERSKPLFVQDTISFHRSEEQVSTSLPSIAEIAASSQRETKSAYASPNRTEIPAWTRTQSTAVSRSNPSPSAYSAPYSASADKEYVPPDATNRLYSPQNIDKQTNTIIREQTAPWPEPPPVVEASEPAIEQEQIESQKPAFPELHWIGQHHGTYI
ncbi:DNA mismatch repair endonuclease MutL, partial [Paenibacillus sp. MCAF20]